MIKFFILISIFCFAISQLSFADHHKISYDEDFSGSKKSYQKRKAKNKSYSAIDNFAKRTFVRKKKRSIKTPSSAINVGSPNRVSKSVIKKPIKRSKYKETSYTSSDIYDDLDIIFKKNIYVGYYKVGKAYKIYDLYYYPQEYEHYEEIGVASWYGEDFDGKLTANGEIYDLSMMTAAHRTLPMPSIVKVTNLANQKSVLVRVNDRGPFAKNRIIDLSKRASEVLDYRDKGTIMVKVELDNEKTRELQDKLRINKVKND